MPCALPIRSEEHTSELQSPCNLVCRLLLEKKPRRPRFLSTPPMVVRESLGVLTRSELYGVMASRFSLGFVFFFNDTATTEIYTLSLHDALPISTQSKSGEAFKITGDWIAQSKQ